jgi:DNA-binding IclR family transcriptional regulator
LLTAEQLERSLADVSSGLSAGAIAERGGVGYSRVLALLRELEASGKVRRTGTRRSTLWLGITDEDRIAQRAAEHSASSAPDVTILVSGEEGPGLRNVSSVR